MKNTIGKEYIPALRFNFLTKFYDLLITNFLKEKHWKSFLVHSFVNKAPQRVLDIGCGTATLSILMKKQYTKAIVIGIDGDPKILRIAEKKLKESNVTIELVQGLSYSLPFPDNYFDVVTSSLMLHHLSKEDKHRTIREVYRVLKPSGEFNVADWGKTNLWGIRVLFYIVQLLDGFKTTQDNIKGLLPQYFKANHFSNVTEHKRFTTLLGSISIYQAVKL